MIVEKVTVKHTEGIHLRVAADIVRIAQRHNSRIFLSCHNCPKADACSVMQLLMLGAPCGQNVMIEADGPDEKLAAAELTRFFDGGAGI